MPGAFQEDRAENGEGKGVEHWSGAPCTRQRSFSCSLLGQKERKEKPGCWMHYRYDERSAGGSEEKVDPLPLQGAA